MRQDPWVRLRILAEQLRNEHPGEYTAGQAWLHVCREYPNLVSVAEEQIAAVGRRQEWLRERGYLEDL